MPSHLPAALKVDNLSLHPSAWSPAQRHERAWRVVGTGIWGGQPQAAASLAWPVGANDPAAATAPSGPAPPAATAPSGPAPPAATAPSGSPSAPAGASH